VDSLTDETSKAAPIPFPTVDYVLMNDQRAASISPLLHEVPTLSGVVDDSTDCEKGRGL
jgi:hypothetical protein